MLQDFLEKYNEVAKNLSQEDIHILEFNPIIENEALVELYRDGFWYILFLGADSYHSYGLRIMPDKNWDEWPVVVMNEFHSCTTIAPRAANLLEFFHFRSLAPTFKSLDYFAEVRDEYCQVAGPLLDCLSNNGGLEYFFQFAADLLKRGKKITPEEADRLIVEFWSYFDPSDEHAYIRGEMTKMMADYDYVPVIDPTRNYGPLQTRLYHLVLFKVGIKLAKTGKYDKQIINCFDEPHCFDIISRNVDQEFSDFADPRGTFSDFAEVLVLSKSQEIQDDPIFHAAKAIYKEGYDRYLGIEHVEVAAFFDVKRNQPLRCWNALVNAAYWSGQNAEESMPAVWDAAIELCRANNWNDAAYALEYQMKVYKELKKE